MKSAYLGKLATTDPLHDILSASIPSGIATPEFHVTRISSRMVFKYTEAKTRCALVGKFYDPKDPHDERLTRVKGEYEKLEQIRSYGFDSYPHYVVRPISRSERIGLALIEEFIRGKDLDHFIKGAIFEGKSSLLKDRLKKLALFLFALHERTRLSERLNLESVTRYFQKIVDKLWRQQVISDDLRRWYLKHMDIWCGRGVLERVEITLVHGDATPTNFLFTEDGDVVAIDLERSKPCDPMFDVSMVCGELKHAFMWRTGNRFAAEPFIRHFLQCYTRNFPDPPRAFREITTRNPFYMALTELRIARNGYLAWQYRQWLAQEARECLKWGLKLL